MGEERDPMWRREGEGREGKERGREMKQWERGRRED